MSDFAATDPDDDPRRFAERIQAEIAAEAERLRREDPEVARTEREIERAWAHVAPPGVTGTREDLLIDRAERLAMVDVDAPLGARPGVRQVKGAIRKGTYWYLRYMSDQLNAFHNVQVRLLRRIDERLQRLEDVRALSGTVDTLVAAAPSPAGSVGDRAATKFDPAAGPVAVLGCGMGECVAALISGGVSAYGIDADPGPVLAGIDSGLDLRTHDPLDHLRSLDPGTLGGVVVGGAAQRVSLAGALDTVEVAARACRSGGIVVIAPESARQADPVDAELLGGRRVSAAAWARLTQAVDASVEISPVDDPGIDEIVIVRLP